MPVKPNLLQLCTLITTADCQRIFDEQWSEEEPNFNAIAIINEIKNNVYLQNPTWERFSTKIDPEGLEKRLLRCIAECRGEVLHAFLLALKDEPDYLHLDLCMQLEITVHKYECQSVALDEGRLRRAARSFVQSDLTQEQRPLILCCFCGEVMDDPMLLACLHSCCRGCVYKFKSSCGLCDQKIEIGTLKSNLYVLKVMAAAVDRRCQPSQGRSNGCLPLGNELSSSEKVSCLPLCTVHNDELKRWCGSCGKFSCYAYESTKCGNIDGPCSFIQFQTVALNVKTKMIKEFWKSKPHHDVADNFDDFTQKYMNVLKEKKLCLDRATSSAIDAAKKSIDEHHMNFCKEADQIRKQLKQAYLYTQSMYRDDFYIFYQREQLAPQLRLLLKRTGNADRCRLFPENADLHISCTDKLVNVRRLLIECLPENYNYTPVTTELLGMVKVTEIDSPVHLFWDRNCNTRKEMNELSVTALQTEVEMLREKLLDAQKTAETLQQNLLDSENKIKELEAKKIIDGSRTESTSDLVKNLQRTSAVVCESLTLGDVDTVIAELLNHCCINDRDEQNLKRIDVAVNRAEALIDIVKKKHEICMKYFLKSLEEKARRKDLADIIRSAKVPHGYISEGFS